MRSLSCLSHVFLISDQIMEGRLSYRVDVDIELLRSGRIPFAHDTMEG